MGVSGVEVVDHTLRPVDLELVAVGAQLGEQLDELLALRAW